MEESNNTIFEDGPMIPNEVEEVAEQVKTGDMTNEELKDAVAKVLEKTRRDGMLIGYRTAATVLMQTIAPWRQPHCSKREYERIFKKLEEFFGKALQKSNEELFGSDETVQN